MKRFLSTWNFWKHLIVIFLICLMIRAVGAGLNHNSESSSIGIIGGADGPTAVFIAGTRYPETVIDIVVLIVFIVLLALYSPINNFFKRVFKSN